MIIPKVSIIIPFFGVEEYIERCIKSVIAQTFSDFECVLIDDDSPDNSLKIAKDQSIGDNRLKIIKQKNTGIGGARNKGLMNIVGEYVCFLDSDDWWEANFLEVMVSSLEKSGCDAVVCNYYEVNAVNNKKIISNNLSEGIFDNKKSATSVLESPTIWNKLYKTALWENILFPEHINTSEDLATLYKVMYRANAICYINDSLYNYFIRSNSLTRFFSDKKIEDRIWSFEMIESDIIENYPNIYDQYLMSKLFYQHLVLPTYFDIITSKDPMCIKRVNLHNFRKKLNKQYFNYKTLLKQDFLPKKFKFMLFDFISGINFLLFVQKLKRKSCA